MTRNNDNQWLNRFAVATAMATLVLIGLGGLVTSHGVGMAVPDWPTTYGYNMFLFPISQWVGGIFYEHTHRLVASGVGLLTTILAVWLWLKEERSWLRWLGVLAFFLVVLQGVLGGLRVTLHRNELGIVHGTLAQLFLVLVCAMALFTSRAWQRLASMRLPAPKPWSTRALFVVATGMILFQLILGATMRHQHAGLAVPDFPLAYGKLWPPMDEASLAVINQGRVDARDFGPVTPFQIGLHMAHRLGAVLILFAVGFSALNLERQAGRTAPLTKLAWSWLALICLQGILGAATVWSNKAADVATAHVVLGSLSLAMGALLAIMLFRCRLGNQEAPAAVGSAPAGSSLSVPAPTAS